MSKIVRLYDDIYASLYEGILRRSSGSEFDASVGAALGLSGAAMFYLVLGFSLIYVVRGPVSMAGDYRVWLGVAILCTGGNLWWFLGRRRYRGVVDRLRMRSPQYRRAIVIVSWVYVVFPWASFMLLAFVMARAAGQL